MIIHLRNILIMILKQKTTKYFLISKQKRIFVKIFLKKMTNKYEELILGFETKLRKLISEYKSLQEQNTQLTTELDRKQTDLMKAHQEILELRKNYDHLRMAKNLSGSDVEKAESKQKIAGMVREIDKCLALLDE